MTVAMDNFDAFFTSLHGHEPFPWQSRLSRMVFDGGWPSCIDLPTASGKTATIDIAIFVLAAQAMRHDHERTVGRRIFFTVNRRVIVDEAFDRSHKIACELLRAESGILKEVADALRSINADRNPIPLDVCELRGGIYRDRRWARSLTQPMVVATTADQLGSRLLFRGYGVSPSSKPIHAALVGCDSTILLDEAHCTRAFAQSLDAIQSYRSRETRVPPMRYVQMTATPTREIDATKRFQLDEDDLANAILRKRQNASKPARLRSTKKKDEGFAQEIAELAIKTQDDTHRAIGVIVNRVQTARSVYAWIREERPEDACYLVIGRMRPIDRDWMTEMLREVVGPNRPKSLPKPCIVVATQCLEIGADYDFDSLITECASADALRQRFGRLNRTGRDINASAIIVGSEPAMKPDDPVYGDAMLETWKWLNEIASEQTIDFGIAAFKPRWDALDSPAKAKMLAPADNAAVLLPAHLDALCQTAPEPEPSPDVSYFIHGPQRSNVEVQVCWRADLRDDERDLWAEIVSLLPPTSTECMTVPLRDLRGWMAGQIPSVVSADIPVRDDPLEVVSDVQRVVLIWRGTRDSIPSDDADTIRPGDTIVIPTRSGGWNELGHIPSASTDREQHATIDVAEQATRRARRQVVLRVRPDTWPARGVGELQAYSTTLTGSLRRDDLRELLRGAFTDTEIPAVVLNRAFTEHDYPRSKGQERGVIFRFRTLLADPHKLEVPPVPEDDADDPLLDIAPDQPIALQAHTLHVVDKIEDSLERLSLDQFAKSLHCAAELHDIGKGDPRFQAMLLGVSPEESMYRPVLLGKSNTGAITKTEREQQRKRSRLPDNFRHEMLSVEILENTNLPIDLSADRNLLMHLIAAHHGYARPFAPIAIDSEPFDLDLSTVLNITASSADRLEWTRAHQLDSGVGARFWSLTRHFGWWGLAYLESVLRLADQQASESEQLQSDTAGKQ